MSHTSDSASVTAAHLELQGAAEVSHARRAVRQFLSGSPEDVIAVAQLLTSELVSNAVEHATGLIRVSFDCVDGILRVRVNDQSARHPVLGRRQVSAVRGRGLLMVESLALSWGVAPDLNSEGKTVWFRLRAG